MIELSVSLVLLVVLLASAWACLSVQHLLPEPHRSRETVEFVRLVNAMMVTFTALVLGLLITSVKADFDGVGADVRGFSIQIIELNRLLHDYGPDTAPERALLREYTAAAIATTWTEEKAPPGAQRPAPSPTDTGEENSALGRMLEQIGRMLRGLQPSDPAQRLLAAQARTRFESLMERRWRLIEDSSSQISVPFYLVMVFWLVVIFASFGLSAPRNMLVYVTILLCAISIASAVFVTLEMSTPFGGFVTVSSAPMRDALAHVGG
ncbi:MAG TPA: hypothetical protein VME92_14755 [Acetobacteraceae bacterium]|nr:hypothetical protein [Acetobacteraceae bacterium]